MYCYEVFVLKDEPIPDILQSFEKTSETRFHAVYIKDVPQDNHYTLDRHLEDLQGHLKISYYYWAFVSVKAK